MLKVPVVLLHLNVRIADAKHVGDLFASAK